MLSLFSSSLRMTANRFQYVSHIRKLRLHLQDWHRGYKVQVKCFSMLLSLSKLLLRRHGCRTFKSRPPHLGWAAIIQAGVNLSYSIYWTQCVQCVDWEQLHPPPYRPSQKTHSSHWNNQAQKSSLTKKERTQSIQNASVKCLKERGLSESTGSAEARSHCPALLCLCSC